ncbi:MAG: CBS domain-containing protein [Methermicoccaceae archaeon]
MEVDLRVKDIMTREVVKAEPTMSIDEIARLMKLNNVSSVVIVDNDVPVGIISERDIVRKVVAKNKFPRELNAYSIMSTPPSMIDSNASIAKTIETMLNMHVKRLPVIEDERLVGIITDSDVIHVSAELIEKLWMLVGLDIQPISMYSGEGPEEGEIRGEISLCEVCGQLSENLEMVDGKLMCESCRELSTW